MKEIWNLPYLRLSKLSVGGLATAAALFGATLGAVPASAKSLVIARDMDMNSLDLHRAWCESCIIYNNAVYEGLLTLDANNKLVPVIAESWQVSNDLTTFTFKINPKATFSDGSKVEAKDVKWSWERLQNIKGNAAELAEAIASVDAPDPATVIVKTKAPNSEFLNVLTATYFGVINRRVAETEGKANAGPDAAKSDSSEPWFFSHSAGAGPFVLESYEPGSELRLKRNEHYWRKPANVDEVIMRQVGDTVAQAQLLQSGQVDIAMQVDAETAKTLTSPNVKVESAPSFNFIYVAIGPGAVANPFPMTMEIREAISIAIDRKSLIDFTVGEGNGELISVPFPIGFPGASGHAIPEYNPEKAKAMLAHAGKADGFTLDATYPQLNVYGVDLSIMMQKIQQDLAKVKITLDLKPVEMSAWRQRVSGDHIPFTGAYYSPDFYGTSQFVQTFGLAEGTLWYKRGGAERDPSYLLPENLKLMAEALKAKPADAEKIWFKIGENIKSDNVILPMLSPNLMLTYGSKVHGVRNSAICILPLYDVSIED
ncbi:ABC transporter substrate-binding protein [Agrobacterium vitis]|uniref:ABC transporter substrate-binding protein n=2 Tax=Rhizobiaceae TaxID=82115 RepID=UPI0008FBA5C4|nr:ABC transporter substrate-binding protein [Allorhizobium ampelinum]MUZ54197.1 ABC transporter substrate-binding protein [Agrobacterium vitis]MCF1495332.1 ABC transporter substrate-binding protein [Allorhizobium ampelinum]MUZ93880.1 ABC transporter substrate-binding protein [Agrobacterium vitis]MVA41978.1 ABC transporter substrate-binding protein [Agrobacterium vitis]